MKVKTCFWIVGLSLLGLANFAGGTSVSAASNQEVVVDSSYLENLKDSEKVIQMPEGGFLHGEATVYSVENPTVPIAQYNSETDGNAVTVGEIKTLMRASNESSDLTTDNFNSLLKKEVRGSGVPTKKMELGYGASYTSNAFTGSGWRFSGYLFSAKNSPLPNLV